MNIIIKAITNPNLVVTHLCRHWPFNKVSDEFYLKHFFKAHQRCELKLENPTTFNEKLQWLKLHDRNEMYTTLSDKYLVRDYVENKIGKQYLIPLHGVWDSVEQINIDDLPEQFVLKCNHDSGSVAICKSKNAFQFDSELKKLSKALKTNYYWKSREYNYFNINRKIIAEEYISDAGTEELTDYKLFCFNGKVHFTQVDTGRFSEHIRNFYDQDWHFINVSYGCKNDPNRIIPKPKFYDEMKHLAEILSEDIPHVRVDFYYANNQIYFGELTFHHGGGVMVIEPKEYDYIWGELINIELVKKNEEYDKCGKN